MLVRIVVFLTARNWGGAAWSLLYMFPMVILIVSFWNMGTARVTLDEVGIRREGFSGFDLSWDKVAAAGIGTYLKRPYLGVNPAKTARSFPLAVSNFLTLSPPFPRRFELAALDPAQVDAIAAELRERGLWVDPRT